MLFEVFPKAIMDYLFIDDLRVPLRVGVYPREQAIPQTVEISLKIGLSSRQAGESDKLADTIDYSMVIKRLLARLGEQHFNLIEKMAETAAAIVLNEFGAHWVRVSITKFGTMRDVKRSGIVIERSASGIPAEGFYPG